MAPSQRIIDKRPVILWLSLLLVLGFLATTIASYQVSKSAIQDAVASRELPLTSDNIYSEIQKDLIRPVFISSMMASDTFLRDWVIHGETDVQRMTRYLAEVKERYGAFTSFFVSDRSGQYYHANGLFKQVQPDDPRDAWYYRVRQMQAPYEINVDPDQANRDTLTIFVNYRVFDYQGHFIGATGVGLTVDAVRKLIGDYQQRYGRNVYFVSREGKVILFGKQSSFAETEIQKVPGLKDIAERVLAAEAGSYAYSLQGREYLLNARLVPELNWYLFVEKAVDADLGAIRRTLYLNLAICAAITLVVLLLARLTLNRYQGRLEEMATIDCLTGLINRQAGELMFVQAASEFRRAPKPLSVLIVDIDHFKAVNDRHGHQAGDRVIQAVARQLKLGLRESDVACRWGGEEFLLLLRGCTAQAAEGVADKLRRRMAETAIDVGDGQTRVTLSIGVTEYAAGDTPESATARADTALYAAKEGGRDRVCLAAAPVPA